jgi:hypothetical protein
MKSVVFETASSTSDWSFQYRLLQAGHAAWDPAEEIVLGMSPDYVAWNDYGVRQRSFPAVSSAYDTAPWFQASSRDGSGVVVLTDPDLIDVQVPWNQMRMMGPGSVHVSLSYRRGGEAGALVVRESEKAHRIRRQRRGQPWGVLLSGRSVQATEAGVAPLVPDSAASRITLLTGTLPLIDGVV